MTGQTMMSLRPFSDGDAPFFTWLATDERVTRFIGDGKPWGREAISARVEAALQYTPVTLPGATRWFVAQNHQGPVGVLVSTRRDAGVEIGYWVSPDHWGRGIAGSMVEHALAVVPGLFGSEVLVAHVSADNAASARVLTRRGFHLVSSDGGQDQYTRSAPTL